MRDHLTFATLAGRRRWRRYVIAAAFILVFVGLLFGWVGWQRVQAWVERSGSDTSINGEMSWQASVSSRAKETPTPDAGSCPTDPELWALLDVYPGDNYKRIEPDCVYEDLAKSVAWHMLVRFGYTKPEAAELLDFPTLPWRPAQSIKGLTNTKGPMDIPLEMEWAPHPAFRTWVVDSDGQPALAYSLRGCYRTRAIVGSEVDLWGPYPVICVLAYDREPGWTVVELGEQRFTVDLTSMLPGRRFAFFGYSAETWVLLGEPSDWQMAIEEASVAGQEREKVTARYGAAPLDSTWLQTTYGLDMHPLPGDWQTFGADPDAIHAIANELDRALQEFGGSP